MKVGGVEFREKCCLITVNGKTCTKRITLDVKHPFRLKLCAVARNGDVAEAVRTLSSLFYCLINVPLVK